MDETEQYTAYRPSHAKSRNKQNDSIIKRSNIQYDSLAGNTFSNTKNSMNFIITDDTMLVADSLKLTSKIKLLGSGDLSGNFYLNGSCHSLVKAVQVYWGGQPIVNITQNAANIAHNNAIVNLSETEFSQFSMSSLVGVPITKNDGLDFELDFNLYGMIKRFLPTGLANFDIKITLESNLAKVFNCKAAECAGTVTGYQLDDCYLNGDSVRYSSDVYEDILDDFRSETGVEIPSFSYSATLINMAPGNSSHNLSVTAQRTNLISTTMFPVIENISKNARDVSEVDTVSYATWKGGAYPDNLHIQLGSDGHPVNFNSYRGCSKKMQHYSSVLNTALGTDKMRNVGSELTNLYALNLWQATSGSWLRGLDNDVSILNSGTDTYGANGLIKYSFNTTEPQTASDGTGRAALIMLQYTTKLKVSAGQIMLIE